MYHIADDERERKSAKNLSEATARLLLEETPQKLTVSLLSKEAGIPRSTFYRLFDEPEDVLKYIADEIFHESMQGYNDLIRRAEKKSLSVPSPREWYENRLQRYAAVGAGFVRYGRSDYLRVAHKKALLEFAPILYPDLEPDSRELQLLAEMRSSIFIACFIAWVETDMELSFEELRRSANRQMKFFGIL